VRVPLEWLHEYCDPGLDARGVEERLTMTGTKVEAIHRHGVGAPERFLVGRVLTCEPHPNADRLSVCTVDLGPARAADAASSEGPATIVCGAPNVAAGQTVAVACPGAVMPNGMEIKRAKLRGVASEGMILAEQELAIDPSPPAGTGILVLDERSQTGRPGGEQGAGTVPFVEGAESSAEGAESPAEGSESSSVESPTAETPTLESPSVESSAVGSSTAGSPTGTVSPAGVPAPGTALARVLPIATEVLELEITPNRPDCLGVYGVARELHAATGAPLAPAPWGADLGSAGPLPAAPGGMAPAEVEVRCPDLCSRFTARVFEHVRIAPSPPWLKARLSAAGQRPINNVVDITNYVMLLTGQPLHAFDLDRVAGGRLVVRRAQDGEQVQTLDGQTRTLDGEMVVIEDGEGPTSIAGVMGGARSEVGETTTRVLMEVANWEGANIHRTSWALGLRSEASGRFEKGLAPEQCAHAQALAARLMLELCGAALLPGTIDVGREPAAPLVIRLREARVQAILGVPVARTHQQEILNALDFQTREAPDGLDVTVPALRRADVKREADLIEEVARIDGLEKLPATLPPRRPAGMLAAAQRLRRRAVDTLVGRGLYETVGWTFTSRASMERLRLDSRDPRWAGAVALENPLSEEHALLRTTLLGSLLDSAARNAARENLDLRIFEVGTVFQWPAAPPAVQDGAGVDGAPQPLSGAGGTVGEIVGETASAVDAASADPRRDTGIEEHRALGILLSGRIAPPTWREPDPPRADLYAVKGALEALAAALRVPVECAPADEHHPFLHPGRAAEVLVDGASIGWLGELHPLVADRELEGAAVMEVDLDRLIAAASARRSPSGADARGYRDLISFPALRQDLAVVLPREVPAAVALAVVRETAGGLLADARVFDVYEGPQVRAGMRSLALTLSFRAGDRTLSDDDVAPLRERIVAALGERLGGELRG
jgi:phenylalanyl-tRNA synthetase beta chain